MHLHYYSKTIGSHYIMTPNCFNKYAIEIGRGKSPITDPLLIPTPSRISVNIRVIKKLYIHELLVI